MPAPNFYDGENRFENLFDLRHHVFGKKPEDQKTMLLKRQVFASIPAVALRVSEVKIAVDFDRDC